jgi:hypothetical protein
MGIVDGDDTFVAARLVIAFCRSLQRGTRLRVGQPDLVPIERREQATEGLPSPIEVARSLGVRGASRSSSIPANQPSSSSRRISVWAGERSTGTTRGPAVGF